MTRLRFHELVGRRVVDRDGRLIDHVVDLTATPVDGRLTVSALLVGPAAFLARIGQRRWLVPGRSPIEIPWGEVVEVGDEIRVAIDGDAARRRRTGRPSATGRPPATGR
jgi:sporulation protein YlmC with PRC-barrel domain